jgi:hypothetical protein
MAATRTLIQLGGDGVELVWTPTTLDALGKSEEFLEERLANNTEILGLETIRSGIRGPFRVFRQLRLATPSGRTILPDITILTASGHIVVVEVKRHGNQELRDRAVIAQILDYASSFADLSDDQLIEMFGEQHGDSTWADLIATLFGDDADGDELSEVLRERISTGQINLVIACDKVPIGLPEIVRGVSTQSAVAFELDLVEVVPFVDVSSDNDDILFVPSTRLATEIVARTAVTVSYRQEDQPPSTSVTTTPLSEVQDNVSRAENGSRSRRNWTIEEVEGAFTESEIPGTTEFLDFCRNHSSDGQILHRNAQTTQATVNLLIDVMRDGKVIKKTLFYWPIKSQKLWMRLGDLEEFLSADDFVRLKELLIQLFGDLIDVDLYFLTFPITILPGQLESLEQVANWITDRLAVVR